MQDTLKDYGTRVRDRRKKEGWTQEELAQKVSISRTYLSQIEQGKATNLSFRLAKELNTVLGLETPDESTGSRHLPPGLREFIREREEELPKADKQMLAQLAFRGKQARTKEEWRLLYNVIRATLEDQS